MEISAAGILVCLISSFLATHIKPVRVEADIENALKLQLIVTTILMAPVTYFIAHHFLPASFTLTGKSEDNCTVLLDSVLQRWFRR